MRRHRFRTKPVFARPGAETSTFRRLQISAIPKYLLCETRWHDRIPKPTKNVYPKPPDYDRHTQAEVLLNDSEQTVTFVVARTPPGARMARNIYFLGAASAIK